MNFRGDGSGNFNFPPARQNSVYSLTFDEFRNSVGKEFESMNMDELIKSIWSAENLTTPTDGVISGGGEVVGSGSLALPRTLSQKTVDEVWREMSKEFGAAENVPQREPTLGEVTLEEFLARAGVVKEDAELDQGELLGDLVQTNNVTNVGFGIDFEKPLSSQQLPIYPKQAADSYAPTVSVIGGGGVGFVNQTDNGNMGQGFGGAIAPSAGLSSVGQGKRNGDMPYVSPIPCVFNGGMRGRKRTNTVEKVIERRQKRMIKNRESAARSRARKQEYTTALEEEVAKLKEENIELRLREVEMLEKHKKQVEILEKHKKQMLEIMKSQHVSKKRCLRRTQTGLW